MGSDLAEAKVKWAQLESAGCVLPDDGLSAALGRYKTEGMAHLAPKTRREYESALERLRAAFGAATFAQIRPMHIRQYLDRRTAKVAGNREIAVLSLAWNWCRERGITDLPNPCTKIRNRENRREILVTDDMVAAVYGVADQVLRDYLDLAELGGQREADILRFRRTDVQDGRLWVRQGKTGARVGIALAGEFGAVVDAMLRRERSATGPYLIQTDAGQRVTYAMLRKRFDAARIASGQTWQLRDLRAKAATDSGDLRKAQELLGHRSETTTAAIYRRVRGAKVEPVK